MILINVYVKIVGLVLVESKIEAVLITGRKNIETVALKELATTCISPMSIFSI